MSAAVIRRDQLIIAIDDAGRIARRIAIRLIDSFSIYDPLMSCD